MKSTTQTLSIDNELIVCEYELRDKNALIIHGGGPATRRQNYYEFADELLKSDIGVVLFDMPGQGESSGTLKDSSLERRARQTQGVINQIVPTGPLYLIGFSMGAQTVCDLLPEFGDRTESILLACPAIYAADVHNLRFGDPDFTKGIREPENWKTSQAPKPLSDFDGKTIIAIGSEDEVIPPGVIDLLKAAAKNLTYKVYPKASHKFVSWLSDHPDQLESLTASLAL